MKPVELWIKIREGEFVSSGSWQCGRCGWGF